MISRSYIHEYAPHDQFMCESYYLVLETKDILNGLINLENIIAEKEYFGESVENEIFVLEAEKKNIFTRIGEAIINIFNSFIDLLKDTGKSIKDSITNIRKKSVDDKFVDAMKENPKLADDFLQGVLSGNIKAHDVKDLNKLLDEATKITNDLTKGTIDKKTHGERIEELLEKFGNGARNITAILGLVSAGVGAYKGIDYMVHGRKEDKAKRDHDKKLRDEYDKEHDKENKAKTKLQKLQTLKTEIDIDRSMRDENIDPVSMIRYNDRLSAIKKESFLDEVDGAYLTEKVSFHDAINKVLAWFSEHFSFCNDILSKINSLKEDLTSKAKDAKNSEEGERVNTAIAGLQKVFGAISKELTTVRNASSKLEAKFN